MRTIDLNADVGEGEGDDARLIPLVASANIACGAHAGDEQTMTDAVQAAVNAGVTIGAHPGHADRKYFGRRELPIIAREASALIVEQVSPLVRIAQQIGSRVSYVKLHGALYHQAGRDTAIAEGIIAGIQELKGGLALLGQPGGALESAAEENGVPFFAEAFADRRYESAGVLSPRGLADALIEQPLIAAEQAVRLALRGEAVAHDGRTITAQCDSLCVHGDTPAAVATACAIRTALAEAGVEIRSFV